MKIKIIGSCFLALSCYVFVACSSDDNKVDFEEELHIAIPDASFESKLIEQGIDSDGILSQHLPSIFSD